MFNMLKKIFGFEGTEDIINNQEYRAAVHAHIIKVFDNPEFVILEEQVPDKIFVDVYWVQPTVKRPFHILITNGMSSFPLNKGIKGLPKFGELVIMLPPDWEITAESVFNENEYWPIRLLKETARLPILEGANIASGMTFSSADEYYAKNTKFNGAICLSPPPKLPKTLSKLKVSGETINFFNIVPLYDEEINFKLDKGPVKLFKKLEKLPYTSLFVVDTTRKNVCKGYVKKS